MKYKYSNKKLLKDLTDINLKEALMYSILFLIILMTLYLIFIYFGLAEISIIGKLNIVNIVVIGLLSPFLEEMIFRYFPYKVFGEKHKYLVMIISSLIFAIAHGPNVYKFLLIYLASTLLFLILFKTKRISNTIIAHCLWNFVLILIICLK